MAQTRSTALRRFVSSPPALGRWTLPALPVAGGALAILIVNAWLLLMAAYELPNAFDWAIMERAARLAGEPELYDPRGTWTFVWSPVAAHVLQLIVPIGLTLWRILTVACALAMPTWRSRLLVLASGPFWLDFATGNIITLLLLSAVWALRGSNIATGGFLLATLLIPRPLMMPLAIWLLWYRPNWRLPFAAMAIGHLGLVLATGLGQEWISTIFAASPAIQGTTWNLSPTRWFGLWWLIVGVPLAAWLTWKGRLGLAGLAASPHIWPYYLLFTLPDVNRGLSSSLAQRKHGGGCWRGHLLNRASPDARVEFSRVGTMAHVTIWSRVHSVPTWIPYLTIAGLNMLPGLLAGPSLDAAVFEAVAWRLSEGDALYADVWDHKPPGLYTPSLLAHLLTGDSSAAWRVTWVISILCVVATAWLIERILRGRGLGWPARLAGLLSALVLSSYLLTLGGGMGELYAAVPAALSVTLAATGSDRVARWYVAGLVAGLAWTISLQLAAAAGMLAVLGLSAPLRVAGLRAVSAILGVLTVLLLMVGAGVLSGTTAEAWDALVTYNGAYRLEAVAAPSATLLPWTFLVLLPLVVPASMAVIQARLHSADRLLVIGSMAWIALGVMTIGFQGRLYGHYAISLVVPLGLLAGIGFRGLAVSPLRGARGRLLVAAPIAMTVVLSLIVGGVGASMEQRRIRDSNERIRLTAPEASAMTRPGDTILVWGNEPRLYEATGRAPALRYIYLYPILTDGYVTPELIADLVRELTASPPAIVIDAGSPVPGEPGFPPLLIDRPVATDGRDTDLMDPLRTFIVQRYCPVSEVAGWPIYRYAQAGRCTS